MAFMTKLIPILIFTFLFFCSPNKQILKESNFVVIKETVHQKLADMIHAAEEKNAEKIFNDFWDNDQGAVVRDGRIFLTTAEALESYKNGFAGVTKMEYKLKQELIHIISPKVALVTIEGISTVTIKDGRSFETSFCQTIVFELREQEWKAIHAHISVPPRR
jgi:hypothetical protein